MSTEFTYRMSATGRGNPPDATMVGFYDYRLVALSVVIAVLAAYPALDLGGRVTATRGHAAALHGCRGQRDQRVLARAPTVPRVPGRPSEQSEDVPAVRGNGSVVSQLRAESPFGRLGDVPRTEESKVIGDVTDRPLIRSDEEVVDSAGLLFARLDAVVTERASTPEMWF